MKPRTTIALMVGLGFLLAAYNVYRSMTCAAPVACVGKYWADFWLVSYSDGYERRALLGYLMQLAFGRTVHYLALNLIAFLTVMFLLVCMYWKFATESIRKQCVIPVIMLLSGPTTTVMFEVLGDPLHIALALFLLYSMVSRVLPPAANLLLAILTSIAVILIHEASIFILIPAIYVVYCNATEKVARFDVAAVFVIVVATIFAFLFSNQTATGSGLELVATDGSILSARQYLVSPYFDLLKDEVNRYFGSVEGLVRFVYKIFGVASWPVLAIIVIRYFNLMPNLPQIFFFLLVLSLPLYVIAHDWGRFSIYSFSLATIISASLPGKVLSPRMLRFETSSLIDRLFSRVSLDWRVACLFPLAYFAHDQYRIWGIRPENVVYLYAAAALLFLHGYLVRDGQQPTREKRGARQLE